jgi:hypothetical protein
MVELEFPVYEPISEWKVTFEQKGTQAVVDPTRGELVIVPRFSKRTAAQGFDWSIRCPKDGLIVNMHSNPQEPRVFLDLKTEFAKWLRIWTAHFDVEHRQQIQLHYVNVLNRESVAGFMSTSRTIEAGRILKIFVDIPGIHKALAPPINCLVNLALDAEQPAALGIHLFNGPDPQPSLRLDLVAQIVLPPQASIEDVLNWLNWCHDRILERFDAVFTDEAKKSFGPLQS